MTCSDHAVLLKATAQHSTAVERRPCCAVALRRTAWSEHGMASVNQTRPHCVNQMGKTHSKPLAARHGRGTACYVWIGLKGWKVVKGSSVSKRNVCVWKIIGREWNMLIPITGYRNRMHDLCKFLFSKVPLLCSEDVYRHKKKEINSRKK